MRCFFIFPKNNPKLIIIVEKCTLISVRKQIYIYIYTQTINRNYNKITYQKNFRFNVF